MGVSSRDRRQHVAAFLAGMCIFVLGAAYVALRSGHDGARGGRAQAATMPPASTASQVAAATPNVPASAGEMAATASPSVVGTRDTVLASPQVPRPSGTPCIVELFRNVALEGEGRPWFGDGDTFAYAPPAACPGPWAKVILKVDVRNADPNTYLDGLMFAHVSIGGVPLYSGGGQDNDVPTHWHVERDVTDYSAVLRQAAEGILEARALPRYPPAFHQPYHVTATLLFYPPNALNAAPRVADQVLPLAEAGWHSVATPADRLSALLQLPRNVERAYLDIMAHPRYGNDLFWFTCMPDAALAAYPELRSPLAMGPNRRGLEGDLPAQGCGGGSFRHVLVRIDGQPAGLAPIHPRLYPQLNPLWNWPALNQPTPPPQALNFLPYRVDLSPFAGVLSDGAPHEVSLSVLGSADIADFDLTGTLLVYRDASTPQVAGVVTANTLAGQSLAPTVAEALERPAPDRVAGSVTTAFERSYVIDGYVDTSRGRVRNVVEHQVRVDNRLTPRILDAGDDALDDYQLDLHQSATMTGTSRRYLDSAITAEDKEYTEYWLRLQYRDESADLRQRFNQRTERWRPNVARYYTRLNHWSDLGYAPGAGQPIWFAEQRYLFRDSYASCYRIYMGAEDGALLVRQEGADCPDNRNRMYWAAHPDGSPDSLGWAER